MMIFSSKIPAKKFYKSGSCATASSQDGVVVVVVVVT
jgi:uncharacterized protein (DUF2237 family)